MEDRELLELAANAAGIISDGLGDCYDFEREKAWNPLENDDDAFRLAAMLRFQIIQPDGFAVVYSGQSVSSEQFTERSGGDIKSHRAALRRAIVRAAAYIGERGA